MELSAPPPQLASNIPVAIESATQKQVVGTCARINDFPQGEWLPAMMPAFGGPGEGRKGHCQPGVRLGTQVSILQPLL
jgi:hypothetical protein